VEARGAAQTPGFDSRAESQQAAGALAVLGNRSGRRSASPTARIRVRIFDIPLPPTELFGSGAGVLDPDAGLVLRQLARCLEALAQFEPVPVKRPARKH